MSSDDAFLAAASIGQRIVTDAIWHDGVCSWVGAIAPDPTQPSRTEYRALEPSLYDGTAGVALFLAQLGSITGDDEVRRTAVGAARHAVSRASAAPGNRRDGFHGGSIGIAWAAARAGALLGEEALLRGSRDVLAAVGPPQGPDRCPDVVLGGAGSILGLLALADVHDDEALIGRAFATGGELIAGASVTRHGWSWATPGRRYRHHLCGLSHGAAGIGWALLELFAATGDERFRTAAAGAFAYERSWLETSSGRWPDLRIAGQRRKAATHIPSPAAGTWCHGEGGIALTRMRAIDLLGAEGCGDDARLALATIRRELAGALPYEIADLTLCHGAAGQAEVLLCGAAMFGEGSEASSPATELGDVALDRYEATSSWPCDAAGGTTPGLFRGISGIAWWLLRLHDRRIPSPVTMPSLRLTTIRDGA